jgi:hypothetical protein
VNYAKLLEMIFFTLHSFLEVGKTHDLPSKFWQTLGDAMMNEVECPQTSKTKKNAVKKRQRRTK